ncbi:hypothetical protein [Kitasatospora cineracea]|uniref:Lipocalin-like domain-containing protein n=1 Tax=Kitasatospora cineracea TaxID=88074 RepID=A0A8G1UKP4_9ACTN|nr:hypothetical protein [Kitasatospora cineracea]ROR45643.1 hypothetical protein EDD39_3885 [Kitasatospora cineracea]
MGPLASWRAATAVLPRRTALRLLGASAVTAALAACSGKSLPGSGGAGIAVVALGKFAAGTWKVSAPDAHYHDATLTVTESGTWTGEFVDEPDQDPTTMSGTWTLAGQRLQLTIDDRDGTAADVPADVAGDASAAFTWTYQGREEYPDRIQAHYTAESGTLALTVGPADSRPQKPLTITAVRS